ncbi:hypothetical protein [Diplocloster modestus]|uniref:Uncharacterized protein n=1 Tax=Diplocloster modestus TaxID=2850322 RepID=A0ABS6KDH3_9FIRM|nr:hypothetical protein [Diplocloster modestus]MBU9728567.1 hypothetical protein [Diplocloster modestus]
MNSRYLLPLLLAALSLSLCLSGCALHNPKAQLKEQLEALKHPETDEDLLNTIHQLDQDKSLQLLDYDHGILASRLLENYDYQIQSSKITGEKAEVTIKLTTRNMEQLMDAYRSEILNRYITSGPMGQASALDCTDILSDILNSSSEFQTRRITLSLIRSEDGWAYEAPSTVLDQLTGGLITSIENSGLTSASAMAQAYLDQLKEMAPETLRQYLSIRHFFSDQEPQASSQDLAYAAQIHKNLDYQILSCEQTDTSALVNLSLNLTTADLPKLFTAYKDQLNTLKNDPALLKLTDEEFLIKSSDLLLNLLEESMTSVTIETSLPMTQTNGVWLPRIETNAFSDALLGNYPEAISVLQN